MATETSSLNVASRASSHSREVRRSRRAGLVPGVVYGGKDEPVAIAVDARELRATLAEVGAVIDLSVDGGAAQPVVLKETQRHPVRGEITHVDLLRVDLSKKIQQAVTIELTDVETSVGVKAGGVVEHLLREVTVEALPSDIPEVIEVSIQEVKAGSGITLAGATVPAGVEIIDDVDSQVVNIRVPRAARAGGGEEGDEDETSEESSEES